MKSAAVGAVLATVFRLSLAISEPAAPVDKVVAFIKDLKKEIESDAAAEKTSYNAFKAWCNETIVESTADISSAEQTIEEKNRLIDRLSGSTAESSSQIQYAQKSLKDNEARRAETTATREKELKEFETSKADLSDQIQSVSSALGKLQPSNSSSDATGFLAVKSDRPSAEGAVRQLLKRGKLSTRLSAENLQLLNAFAKRSSSQQQLMQLETESEPPSGLDGVLEVVKGVKEKFEEELASAKAEDAEKAKNFALLVKTMDDEHGSLKTSLTDLRRRHAESAKELADAKIDRDEAETQLAASRKLLTGTQDSCKLKAEEFTERTKLRQQEMKGIDGAIDILTSGKPKASFAQFAKQAEDSSMRQEKAYQALKALAAKLGSPSLAQLARRAQGSGFDQVVGSIKQHIKHLKEEEKEDVVHRDRCKKQMADSAASLATLEDGVKKAETKIELLERKVSELQTSLANTRSEVNTSKLEITERTQAREEDRKEHLEVLKHNKEGLKQLDVAIETITKFYKDNKITVGLAQRAKPAPNAGFENDKYKGSQATNTAVTMLKMVHEDLASDVDSAKAADKSSQEQYEKDISALKALLTSQQEEEISTNKALADLQVDLQGLKESKDMQADQKATEVATKESVSRNCAWVKTNFASRRTKRKAEISGLVEAKALLEGSA